MKYTVIPNRANKLMADAFYKILVETRQKMLTNTSLMMFDMNLNQTLL